MKFEILMKFHIYKFEFNLKFENEISEISDLTPGAPIEILKLLRLNIFTIIMNILKLYIGAASSFLENFVDIE